MTRAADEDGDAPHDPPYEHVFLDTNVLLSASDPSRSEHARSLTIFNQWLNRGTALHVSGQVLREYLVVATRPVEKNGLGLDMAAALHNTQQITARAWVVAETPQVAAELTKLLERIPCLGKQVHDANVVATMLVHGLTRLVTANVQDFQRYAGLVEIVDLAEVPSAPLTE